MDSLFKLWDRIGLQLKLQILIQGFLIVILLFAQYWIYTQLERQILMRRKNAAWRLPTAPSMG
jgi:hypothetical protein